MRDPCTYRIPLNWKKDRLFLVPWSLSNERLLRALDAFRRYAVTTRQEIVLPRRQQFETLPQSDQELLSLPPFSYLDTLKRIETAIYLNAKLASAIFEHGIDTLQPQFRNGFEIDDQVFGGRADESDISIVRSTLRQFYRDWSEEGAAERKACHGTVLDALQAEYASAKAKSGVRILVPGAGLCRLPFSICKAGYTVEANELSYHQILASSFVLSRRSDDTKFDLYPWLLSFSNHVLREDQFEKVVVPDISPETILNDISSVPVSWTKNCQRPLTLNTKDFTSEYSLAEQRQSFDAVVTVFFLDTAPNVLGYMRTVHNCLKSGGIWINVGPLLWNCYENGPGGRGEGDMDDNEACKLRHAKPVSNTTTHRKVELSNDEVIAMLEHFGFAVEINQTCIGEAGYIMDPKSMLQNMYRVSHWVARKR